MTISKGWRRKRVRVCACVGDALPLSCLHVAKNVVALRLKIVLHEGLLAAAVPQVEHEVSQEAHVRVLHIDGRAEPHGVAC